MWVVSIPDYSWLEVWGSTRYKNISPGDSVLCWPEPRSSRTYNLLQLDQKLFLEFAQVETTLYGISKFANRYGLLGIQSLKKPSRPKSDSPYRYVDDEPRSLWARQVSEMRYVVLLWTACQDDDRDTLGRYIRWERDGSRVFFEPPPDESAGKESDSRPPTRRWIAAPWADSDEGLPLRMAAGDVVLPAALLVREFVGQQLRESPQDAPSYQRGVHPRFVWTRDSENESATLRIGLQTWPETLHQALWLQAAAWITEGKPFKQCQQCQRWFPVAHKAPLTRVGFCSDACRVRAYREKQDLARQKAAAGRALDEIARELGSDVKTVERWVTGRNEE
jgi:hypothetical protein